MLDISKSDEVNQIYCLQITPKQNSSVYEVISKQEVYIDYSTGVSHKEVTYDEYDKLKMTMEHKDIQLIDDIYFSLKKKTIVITVDRTEVINDIEYKNVKINEEIAPEEFEIPEGIEGE